MTLILFLLLKRSPKFGALRSAELPRFEHVNNQIGGVLT